MWVVIFIHWIIWAATYARAPHYHRAVDSERNKKIINHTQETTLYKDNAEGWMGKMFENKKPKMKIGEIEEDVLKQIENETDKGNLPREWANHLPDLESLDQAIKELEKKENKSKSEEEELKQKRKNYDEKLLQARQKTIDNIKKQLEENNLSITELNDQRGLGKRLLIDPFKFFVISPLNWVCKFLKIFARSETFFFLLEIILKIVVVKLFCLWISYPESVGLRIQEISQKIQNPQLSLEEREQSQKEMSSLIWYHLFNMTTFLIPLFVFLHPSHLDKTKGVFFKPVPLPYLLIPLLIIPFLFSVIMNESLRQGRVLRSKEIKNFLIKSWLLIIGFSILGSIWAAQNQGNYWWIIFSFVIDALFNLIRLRILHKKAPTPSTFKVWRVKAPPNN
ncbi:MAG: hypothetical protein MRERC_6c039 [Mycoplasmataceae bacterium RC_NB112A]|nr:MAG: hypothetical protein MRERC_13c040 [Mycoplasmataceae bacterium RC_NB112A]KLL01951.1 MAG: hypothetical protein MRERC_6c039 [Mycoplasmataceae bacterium RC_NB112A]